MHRCFLGLLWITALLALSIAHVASAQGVRALDGASDALPSLPPAQPVHVTDLLMERPEARAALETFHYLKETGQLEARAVPPPRAYTLGERRTFKAFNFLEEEREELPFVLEMIGSAVRIWVEGPPVLPPATRRAALDSLRRALEEATPAASVDPAQGIIANSQALIGAPPNVDGDGVLDVLLLNIRDAFDPETNPRFIAGFVDPADLTDTGNARDVLYLDDRAIRAAGTTSRTLTDVLATAAHEYQHLIHLNYDRRELTFVNEGLSEWNEVLNGYRPRRMVYLGDPGQLNVPLLRWSGRGSAAVLFDYQRAGLLTSYFARRLGPEQTGSITRDPARGIDGYRNAARTAGPAWRDVLLDFHTANILNDPRSDPRFGYDDPRFAGVGAAAATTTDGRLARGREGRVPMEPGGVRYLQWSRVRDLELTLEGPGALDARLVATSDSRSTERRLVPGFTETLDGAYDTVHLIATHSDTEGLPFTARYAASWTAGAFFAADSLQFDNGQPEAFIRAETNHGADAEILTRLRNPNPRAAFLATVELPLYFFSQFSNEDAPPPDTEQPFTLVVREVAPDGSPGAALFTRTTTDPRPATPASGRLLRFRSIDLTDDQAAMEALPETFFIGFRDVPETPNAVVYPTSIDSTQNRSYVGTPGAFARLWDTRIPRGGGEDSSPLSLEGTFLPVRAAFFRPTDDPPVLRDRALPSRPAILANAPNPFTHTTTLRYELPDDQPVHLSVFDVRGRRIAVLRDEVQLAGPHSVTIDGSAWGSGVYVVQLRTGGHTVDHSIVLVR
ncbi:MAG: T9SS type A sorting domain-containing protein [Bacteroidetes bacterium]|nr:T9SS type A sorting domain-containing protein [Bacteroidota bacterium]